MTSKWNVSYSPNTYQIHCGAQRPTPTRHDTQTITSPILTVQRSKIQLPPFPHWTQRSSCILPQWDSLLGVGSNPEGRRVSWWCGGSAQWLPRQGCRSRERPPALIGVYDGIGLVCMVMSVNARSWMISGCESIAVILPILRESSKSLTVQSGIVHPLTSFATIGGGTQVWIESATYPWLLIAPLSLHRVQRRADNATWWPSLFAMLWCRFLPSVYLNKNSVSSGDLRVERVVSS